MQFGLLGILLAGCCCRGRLDAGHEAPPRPDVRSVETAKGAALREKPRTLAKVVASLPYGTAVRVIEMAPSASYWKVRTDQGQEGWVRAGDLLRISADSSESVRGGGFGYGAPDREGADAK